jgi:hypothetical protein
VLLRLRFPALVGGHDEQARLDGADTGEHVAEEARMPGHVDEAHHGAGIEHRMSEPEIDGETATPLLLEAIGVGAGERVHQGGLAVIGRVHQANTLLDLRAVEPGDDANITAALHSLDRGRHGQPR